MICQTKIEISALFPGGVFQWHGVAWHFNLGGFFLFPVLLACKDSPSALPFDDTKCVTTLIFEFLSSYSVSISNKRRVLATSKAAGLLIDF